MKWRAKLRTGLATVALQAMVAHMAATRQENSRTHGPRAPKPPTAATPAMADRLKGTPLDIAVSSPATANRPPTLTPPTPTQASNHTVNQLSTAPTSSKSPPTAATEPRTPTATLPNSRLPLPMVMARATPPNRRPHPTARATLPSQLPLLTARATPPSRLAHPTARATLPSRRPLLTARATVVLNSNPTATPGNRLDTVSSRLITIRHQCTDSQQTMPMATMPMDRIRTARAPRRHRATAATLLRQAMVINGELTNGARLLNQP